MVKVCPECLSPMPLGMPRCHTCTLARHGAEDTDPRPTSPEGTDATTLRVFASLRATLDKIDWSDDRENALRLANTVRNEAEKGFV